LKNVKKKLMDNPAPVRCFHLTATGLSGEKHLTSAKFLHIE